MLLSWLRIKYKQSYISPIVYFSLGEKEKDSKNPRLASVDEVTKHIYGLLNTVGADVRFEYNEGNHFGPLIERIEKAITNILSCYA